HSKTENLAHETSQANILIVAVGKPGLITIEHVKKDQIIIDVGISKSAGRDIQGDVDFDSVKDIVSAITPVPGGVGPMTVLGLFENLVDVCSKN
nr:bifunctional methylenetetrahydrofolate dehydrogenase/methenyltetrahydrofolate cyclohydrolase [bacterium]